MKIKKGDTVIVIAGKDKGAKGKVLAAFPREQKVLVEGVNRIKKHERIRTTQRGAKTGGIITQEAPIHVSNVMILDSDGKPTRVGYRFHENGRKIRIVPFGIVQKSYRYCLNLPDVAVKSAKQPRQRSTSSKEEPARPPKLSGQSV